MDRERTYKVRGDGEEPTAGFALWFALTRDQVVAVERAAGPDSSIVAFMRDIAINSSSLPGYNKVSTGCGTGR